MGNETSSRLLTRLDPSTARPHAAEWRVRLLHLLPLHALLDFQTNATRTSAAPRCSFATTTMSAAPLRRTDASGWSDASPGRTTMAVGVLVPFSPPPRIVISTSVPFP